MTYALVKYKIQENKSKRKSLPAYHPTIPSWTALPVYPTTGIKHMNMGDFYPFTVRSEISINLK
jgi:hypothetical protein